MTCYCSALLRIGAYAKMRAMPTITAFINAIFSLLLFLLKTSKNQPVTFRAQVTIRVCIIGKSTLFERTNFFARCLSLGWNYPYNDI